MAAKGRPTEYSKDILKRTETYLESCVDDVEEFHKTRGDKSDSYDRLVIVNLPTIEGLSLFLKVARSSIYLWKEQHKDFSDTLDVLLALQKQKLINGGLSGEYNATIAKLVLASNHDMRDKVDTDMTSGGEVLQTVTIIKHESRNNQPAT
jgi:hypothetical protein